jgi:hypothetical protein
VIRRLLEFVWEVEDPDAGGPLRHAWLHFTSSWFYPAFAVVSISLLAYAILVGGFCAWLLLHLVAYVAVLRFWFDRRPVSRERRRKGQQRW